jgi:hypothetical protein
MAAVIAYNMEYDIIVVNCIIKVVDDITWYQYYEMLVRNLFARNMKLCQLHNVILVNYISLI